MIKRIVKMSFQPDKVEEFKTIFKTNWKLIAGFKGCSHVELLQDKIHPNIFFTFSIWENENDLNVYRDSELFEKVWSRTKVLFNDKPQAWSVEEMKF
ncbi:MAG TPA: antibiotic biosynthesis monooxygenase family protein [Bacteroidia bacterium]|jgi:heme-degrading monooxygenase HmoA|nr:antibiotic biosynthesis monooxygenase family protein [Bacteroidia bacterium]